MNFSVKFFKMGKHAVSTNRVSLGLVNLDEARATLRDPSILHENMKDKMSLEIDPRINLTEEQARKASRFHEYFNRHEYVSVEVQENLDMFLKFAYTKVGDKVHVTADVDKEKLLLQWEKDGFPAKWGP